MFQFPCNVLSRRRIGEALGDYLTSVAGKFVFAFNGCRLTHLPLSGNARHVPSPATSATNHRGERA